MRSLILLISIYSSLACLSCYASTFSGIISKKKSQIILIDDASRETYVLIGSNQTVANYLVKLSTGDYISLDAVKKPNQQILTTNFVNYMGLRSLLGIWIGDDSYCYNFISFTEFVVSTHVGGKLCAAPASPAFTYIINPTSKTWTILISDEHSSYIGDLKFKNPIDAQIELFNSETGDTLRSLHLRR